jgi:hypothetical protein
MNKAIFAAVIAASMINCGGTFAKEYTITKVTVTGDTAEPDGDAVKTCDYHKAMKMAREAQAANPSVFVRVIGADNDAACPKGAAKAERDADKAKTTTK